MNDEDIKRIRERFVKDYKLNFDKGICYTDLFIERLKQLDIYNNGIYDKYKMVLSEITEKFNNMEEYYDYRNKLVEKIINNLCDKQDLYCFSGNEGSKIINERFPLKNLNIPASSYLKDIYTNMDLVSIDLKSANFNALKLFNKEIVNNKETYEDFMSDYTEFEHLKESKYLRQRIFGKTRVSQQIHIEKSIMQSIALNIKDNYKDIEILTLNADEIVFKKPKSMEFVYYLVKNLKVDVHLEIFKIKNIDGFKNCYLKNGFDLIENKPISKIYGVSPIMFPFALEQIYNLPHYESYEYFTNQEGYLSRLIDIPFKNHD